MKKILLACFMLGGCVTVPVPENTFVVTTKQLEQRQVETRRYDGIGEKDLIIASANVLQDMGYTLENSELNLGVLTGNKQREAGSSGEVAGVILLTILAAAAGTSSKPEWDKEQTIRVSLVVRPSQTKATVAMSSFCRVTFQRIVTSNRGRDRFESIADTALYTEFFATLSKSIFLVEQKI